MLMELPMAMLATARIGAVHSVVFAGFSADSLAQRIMDCKPKVVITCNAVKRGSKVINLKDIVDTALAESAKSGISVEACLTYENQSALKRENTKWQEGRDVWWQDIVPNYPTTCEVEWVDAEDPLFLLYTSWGTGKPKGVLHTSGGYMVYSATTFKYAFDYKPSDIYWCTADCGWITGHSYVTYGPMLNGATNVIFEGAPTYPDAGRCWDIVDKFKVTIFCTAPTLVRSLMREGNEYVTRYSRKSLRVLVSVGEPINPSAWRWYFNVVGDSRCPISDTWWQTETGGFMITPLPGAWPQKPGSATFPFFGVQPVIVDEKGVEIEGECSGYLCVKQSWPSAFRTLFGDHERYGTTYFKPFPGYYLLWFFGIAACVKVLLIPSYHSTDFEVHRHWLALTHSLSLSQWYSDQTSPWTLDYPPFFAYFEYFLSFFAHLIDPQIVHMHHGLNYKANTVIYFQRISVILSDLCLLYGVYRLTRNLEFKKRILMWVLVVWSPGLLIVDHMHFQYNGFLLGLLLLSISYLQEGRDLTGGFLFAVLLCFKHLFAVAAPVYFVYLLRHYCWKGFFRGFGRLSVLGALVVAVFAAAYGPFVYQGQIQHVIHRMFPFGRGLCHAYWAPNFWVFYIMLDKGLAFFLRRFGLNIPVPAASFTGGLVGDSSPFAILPQITPLTTFIMVLISISPCLINAWKNPQPRLVARWIVYAYTCGFLFGWHVHEKASLHFVIPMAIVAVHSLEDATHYFLLSIASCYSLFPLLYEPQEYPIKVMLLLLHSIVMYYSFSALFPDATLLTKTRSSGAIHKKRGFYMGSLGMCYLFGLLVVEAWGQFLHPYLLGDKLPFVPLLLVSIYTGLAVMYSWMWQLRRIWLSA